MPFTASLSFQAITMWGLVPAFCRQSTKAAPVGSHTKVTDLILEAIAENDSVDG
jgi:hypothetical protein